MTTFTRYIEELQAYQDVVEYINDALMTVCNFELTCSFGHGMNHSLFFFCVTGDFLAWSFPVDL